MTNTTKTQKYIGILGETLDEARKKYETIEAVEAFDTDAKRPMDPSGLMYNTHVYWYEAKKGLGTNEENLREMILFGNLIGGAREFREAVKERDGIRELEKYRGVKFTIFCTKEKPREIAGIVI